MGGLGADPASSQPRLILENFTEESRPFDVAF